MRARSKGALGVLLIGIVGAAAMLFHVLRYGLSAHDDPTPVEHVLARIMRRYATPSDLRGRKNPVPLTPEVLGEARAHFADHCAVCHGNDGKGQTEMGPKFYPKAPDMTLPETQAMSDGEIFATIENGIRLTGMPGWGNGTADSAYGSWTLVHFIRHLPQITPEEMEEMTSLNPKTRAEWQADAEDREFLEGEGAPETAAPSAGHSH